MDELIREIEKGELRIIISKDIRKYRTSVTTITGLQEREDAREIAKTMKSKIGTGGTYKNGRIELQGDHRETAKGLLVGMGFAKDSIEVL
jgi:translation initiation factor 1